MREHVIVCGLGQVGFQVSSLLLDLGESVSILTTETREEWKRLVQERGALVHVADARDAANLVGAGIHEASVLIACTSSDTTNIEIALDAKSLRPDLRVIVRIFDRNLADRLTSSFGIEAISTASVAASAFALAGLGEHAISEFELDGTLLTVVRVEAETSHLTGKTIGDAKRELGFPVLLRILAGGEVQVDPADTATLNPGDALKVIVPSASLKRIHKLEEDEDDFDSAKRLFFAVVNPTTLPRLITSMWTNTTPELRAVFALVNGVILLSVVAFHFGMNLQWMDALYFVVTTVTTVGYGDITPVDASIWMKIFACFLMVCGSASIAIAYSIVTDYIVSQRLLQLGGRRKIPHHDHVIVVGLGDVGFRAAEELVRAGYRVVVIDTELTNPHVQLAQRRFPTILGDGRDTAILKIAHVSRAKAVIATTSQDAANLSIGLAAKAVHPQIRAVVRILDGEFARKVTESTPLEAAISASAVSAPSFVGAALHQRALTSFLVKKQLFTVAACEPNDPSAFTFKVDETSSSVKVHCVKVVRD